MGEAFITRRGGSAPVPSIFGDGRDGDLYIGAGQTVVLPVAVPHQSVVEKQYKSITIEAGGVLRCSAQNAGLVLRCKGSCTIHGTIDQSLMSPKTNPGNTYLYPSELRCGNGGSGGGGYHVSSQTGVSDATAGGQGMAARVYGGGYSGGGGGGTWSGGIKDTRGGSINNLTVATPDNELFIGGTPTRGYGLNGGGGVGGQGIATGNGAGLNGVDAQYSSGGNGNYGGGVLLLYIGGTAYVDGALLCYGGNGGKGGSGDAVGGKGGGAGGAGGGAIHIVYNTTITNTGNLNVNGGNGGAGGYNSSYPGQAGTSGGIGTVTIKKYVKGMTI